MNPKNANGALYNTLKYLGENNRAVYPVMAIALFKGIFRPIFTLMDKNEPKENRNYAAAREGVTELIALITYPLVSILAEKSGANFIHKQLQKVYVKAEEAGKPIVKQLSKEKVGKILDFVAVCVSAVYIIPQVCNLVLPHAMKALFKNQGEAKPKYEVDMPAAAINPEAVQNKSYPKNSVYNTFNVYKNSSMKVGG